MNFLYNSDNNVLLDEFLKSYDSLFKIDIEKAKKIIKETKKYYNKEIETPTYCGDLEKRWYDSLTKNNVDYSVYDDEYYFTDVWVCWTMYSKNYLKNICKHNSLDGTSSVLSYLKDIKSVIDLGNGIGFTTGTLAQIFDNAKVYGYNIENTRQFQFNQLQAEKYHFKMVSDFKNIGQIDLIFASEYFEHITNPIDHLKEIIKYLNPKYLIIANSFNTISVGHFNEYTVDNKIVGSNIISKMFNHELKENKYNLLKTKMWNNKPNIWYKNTEESPLSKFFK